MSKVISFEKFIVLKEAGLDARQTEQLSQAPQLHSVSEDFVLSIAQRAASTRSK